MMRIFITLLMIFFVNNTLSQVCNPGSIFISKGGEKVLISEGIGLNTCQNTIYYEMYSNGENKFIEAFAFHRDTFFTVIYDTLNQLEKRFIEGKDTSFFIIVQKEPMNTFLEKHQFFPEIIDYSNGLNIIIESLDTIIKKFNHQNISYTKYQLKINYCGKTIYNKIFETDLTETFSILSDYNFKLYSNSEKKHFVLMGYFRYDKSDMTVTIHKNEEIVILHKDFQ